MLYHLKPYRSHIYMKHRSSRAVFAIIFYHNLLMACIHKSSHYSLNHRLNFLALLPWCVRKRYTQYLYLHYHRHQMFFFSSSFFFVVLFPLCIPINSCNEYLFSIFERILAIYRYNTKKKSSLKSQYCWLIVTNHLWYLCFILIFFFLIYILYRFIHLFSNGIFWVWCNRSDCEITRIRWCDITEVILWFSAMVASVWLL